MKDQGKIMNNDEIISIPETDKFLMGYKTFRVDEMLERLARKIDSSSSSNIPSWFLDGIACDILSPNTSWKKGKVKISFEFIPDEPESPLDDIRKTLIEDNQ